jgi:hypothetical protein
MNIYPCLVNKTVLKKLLVWLQGPSEPISITFSKSSESRNMVFVCVRVEKLALCRLILSFKKV